MDRELSATTKQARKRKLFWRTGIALALVIAAVFGFRSLISPGIAAAELRTTVVEQGPVVATITASGTVVPEHEQVITSPIQARIEQVVHNTGEQVQPGDQILLLDRSFTQLAYDKLKDELAQSQHKSVQLNLNLEKKINTLASQMEIKRMRVKSLQAQLEDELYLLRIGGGTQESVKQAELNLKIAQQELAQIERDIVTERQLLKADEQELRYTLTMQSRSIEELQRKMDQAEVRATQPGVITWVKNEIGSSVNAGDIIARMADLSSYRVQATISDAFANQLSPGSSATVRINDTDLQGTIASIKPTVENGTVTFFIALKEKAHALLRPSLRVDVYVNTASRPNTLRVKNGPYFKNSSKPQVYVRRDGELLRREVKLGVSNVDYIELENGVQPGEEIVISDLSEYQHLAKIKIR